MTFECTLDDRVKEEKKNLSKHDHFSIHVAQLLHQNCGVSSIQNVFRIFFIVKKNIFSAYGHGQDTYIHLKLNKAFLACQKIKIY